MSSQPCWRGKAFAGCDHGIVTAVLNQSWKYGIRLWKDLVFCSDACSQLSEAQVLQTLHSSLLGHDIIPSHQQHTQKPLFWSLTPLGPALYDLVEKDALSLKLLIEFLVFVGQGWQSPCCLCLENLGLLANLSG